jgi:formylglycine-generating enzyme required for sulfatase activity
MRGVNWCDAYMYCAWAGKRLCGNPDGGSSDPNNANNPVIDEWYRACSHNADGLHVYPYGLTYDASACNGADYDAQSPLRSLSTCQGGYPGIFDMSGNVIEWEDSCTPTPTSPDAGDTSGASDFCNVRGGSFLSTGSQITCDLGILVQRWGGGNDNGFRCCSR